MAVNSCCRRGARNTLALRVSAYGFCISHLIQRRLPGFPLYPSGHLQAGGVLTWQLVMMLAAEVDLLWGRGEEREDDFMLLANLMPWIQRSRTPRLRNSSD